MGNEADFMGIATKKRQFLWAENVIYPCTTSDSGYFYGMRNNRPLEGEILGKTSAQISFKMVSITSFTSATVLPRERSDTGFLKPCKIGPAEM